MINIKKWYKNKMVILKYHLKKQTFLDRLSIKYKNPLSLYIECVNVCNAACIFCYYPKISDTINKQTMSVEDFSSYIDQFSSVGGSNIGLTPTLGDPLVDKYFNDRLRIIDKSTISNLVFYTNLINLKSSHIDSLVAVKNTKIRIFVSITGFSKEEYAINKIRTNSDITSVVVFINKNPIPPIMPPIKIDRPNILTVIIAT